MPARLACLTLSAIAMAASAHAQSAEAERASTYYSADYEVGGWSLDERRRPPSQPASYGSYSAASDELLGGPVPQVERHQIDTGYSGDIRVVMTDARREREADVRPGTQIQTASGTPLGRVAVVERNANGEVSSAWVQQPNSNSQALREVPVKSISLRNGDLIVETG